MSAFLFDKFREAREGGLTSWTADDIRVLFLKSGYTPNQATVEFMSDIPAGNRITGGLSTALGSKTRTGGVVKSGDITVTGVAAGQTLASLVLIHYTGVEGTSRVRMFTDEAIPVPFTTNGNEIVVDSPAAGWSG